MVGEDAAGRPAGGEDAPRRSFSLRVRAQLRRWRDDLFTRAALVGSLLAVALGLLIWPGLGLRSPVYEVGEIAARSVRAGSGFTYEDAAATEERRREAIEMVPDVYDFDPQAGEGVRTRLAAAFSFGREAVRSESVAESAFADTFFRLLDAEADPAGLALLQDLAFAPEVERSLGDAVASVLARDILADKGAIAALGRPVQRRDPAADTTRIVNDFSNILSVGEAREAVHLQVLALSDLIPDRRQALAAFSATLVHPTLERNEVETTRLRSEASQSVETVVLQVRRGRTIIRAGDEVTPRAHRQLLEMRASSPTASGWAGLGALLFAGVLVGLLRMLLQPARRGERWAAYAFAFAGAVIVIHLGLARVLGFFGRALAAQLAQEPFSDPTALVWAAPFASAALLTLLLENTSSALLTGALFSVSVAIMTGSLPLGLFALLTGFAAVFFHRRSERPVRALRVGALVGLVAVVLVVAMELLRGGYGGLPRLALEAASAFLGGLFSAALTQLALPFFEAVFERTSENRLMELSRRDSPLLRELALTAPATYQHSVLVGILAESAAAAVGANPALCSTAALYHDIGKLRRARYFVENIRGESPHESLPPEESADIIRRHVTEGIEYARRMKLPQDIVDVIPQHHGTRLIRFFHEKAKRLAEEEGRPLDEAAFRYAGPKPQTREAAIIMMADGVEAAARSVRVPGREELERVIDRITESLVEDRQLDECDLTLGDLSRVRASFLSTLQGIHHGRVSYPGFEFDRSEGPRAEAGETPVGGTPVGETPVGAGAGAAAGG